MQAKKDEVVVEVVKKVYILQIDDEEDLKMIVSALKLTQERLRGHGDIVGKRLEHLIGECERVMAEKPKPRDPFAVVAREAYGSIGAKR